VTKAPRPRTTLQRRAIQAATTRLPFKFGALGLALVLWAIVSIEEPTEERVNVTLQPVPTDSAIIVKGPLPAVHAWVIGRGRDLFRLVGQPPVIRMPITAEEPETLTVRLTPDMVDLPTDINARVREVQPTSVQLQLDVLAERFVPVASALSIEHDQGMMVDRPMRIEPESVLVAGPRTIVQQLDSVYTRRIVLRVTDTLAQIVALDTARLGVVVTPARVSIRVWLAPSPASQAAADSLPP
jgi:hypothetical protein